MRTPILALSLLSLVSAAEPFRPAFHFSPKKNWTNDPCGLFYKDGVYHLFFQYNPEGDQWGHMSWGHATSRDLIHWDEHPVAIPEGGGVMIFTGSSVVEPSGRIASIYTGHRPTKPAHQNQNVAYSKDAHTWVKYEGNPVLDIGNNVTDFRDPKVFWHAPSQRWIMVVMLPLEHKAQFYASADLRKWSHLSDFGPAGVKGSECECPDFYQLPVDGNPKNTRWVLKVGISRQHVAGGSGEQYFIGTFDGTKFVNDNPAEKTLWLDYGPDCYCEFSFSNTPSGSPPKAVGWMSNWVYAGKIPTSPWRGQMTMPRQFSLRTTPAGIRLFQDPPPEMRKLRGSRVDGNQVPEIFEMKSTVKLNAGEKAEWTLLDGLKLGYDGVKNELYLDRTHAGDTSFSPQFPARYAAPVTLNGRPLDLDVFVDRSSIEVFAMQGEIVFTALVFPRKQTPLAYTGPKATTEIWHLGVDQK
jgi:sucrose-6-phosphate hydrolase SacC (GH32 family)